MKKGSQRIHWLALALVMLLCLFLISLESFTFQPARAVAKSNAIKIMPLGDSITYGQYSSTGGGYRLPLWNDLTTWGAHIDFVGSVKTGPANFDADNEGHPGWKISQIAAHVVGWLNRYQPRIILLHIGTNDFVKNDDPTHAPERLKGLIEQITTTLPEATLIVAQIIPLTLSPRSEAEVVAYNNAIPGIVRSEFARGKHVQYVDMYGAFSSDLFWDHIHPNDRGYERMAKVWERALVPLLKLSRGSQTRP